jgi:type IV secretory pathway VirB10-like protein
MIFTIDSDNEIVAHETAPAAQDGMILFATEKEFTKATAEWPISRLVETWNGFAGVPPFGDLKPVKKFENRTKATRRIWTAIQKLAVAAPAPPPAKPETKVAPKAPAKRAAKKVEAAARKGTHKATVLAMIQRPGGATLDEIMATTGWQKHTIRGFISVAPKRAGLTVTSTRRESDKARVYEAR